MSSLADTSGASPRLPDNPEQPWAHLLGHLLWEVSARISALGEAALSATPLSQSALGVLDWIATQPGITGAEITRRAPTTQQAISQVTTRLQKLGFIERRLSDGRGVALFITPAGAQARADGNAVEERFEERLQELLGRDRYDRLLQLLEETRALVVELDDSVIAAVEENHQTERADERICI
jgi:DNA-binding MarR family transcriptional regulator